MRPMSNVGYAIVAGFAACLVGSAISFRLGAHSIGMWLAVSGLIASGWAAIGHLVTLDDDVPGGWSNPADSRPYWYRSLRDLVLKFLLFGAFLWLLIAQP